jgi:hypothetical protein
MQKYFFEQGYELADNDHRMGKALRIPNQAVKQKAQIYTYQNVIP